MQVVAHRLLGQASPFASYIGNLPMGVPGLPMFFSGEALRELQYPPVTEQVRSACWVAFGFLHWPCGHEKRMQQGEQAPLAATAAWLCRPLAPSCPPPPRRNAPGAGEEALPLAALLHAAGAPGSRAAEPAPVL